jgi:hypothetical protein
MVHSTSKRKARDRAKKILNDRVANLQRLKEKHMPEVQSITLEHVSLGDLRHRYKPTHQELHPAIRRMSKNFQHYNSSAQTPLLIYGSDGGLLAARIRLQNQDLIKRLSKAIDALPENTKHYKFKGIKRGEYQTRHYGVWAAYMPEPRLTAEHRADGDKVLSFTS